MENLNTKDHELTIERHVTSDGKSLAELLRAPKSPRHD